MSYYTKKSNPMHSSQIIYKHQESPPPKNVQDSSKLSHLYTKATSQMGSYDNHQYSNLVQNYENRLKNMQIGFERSKEQFENTLKQMYRQKIILLNIISHNQEFVDEFRSKVRMNPQGNFKEVETKYNILSSGLFHNQLCSNCVLKISKAQTQSSKTPERSSSYKTIVEEKQKIKKLEKSTQKIDKAMGFSKQYSWMYTPTEDFRMLIGKLKHENAKLRNSIQEHNLQNSFRINEKNKEIQALKSQISKLHLTPSKITHDTNHSKQSLCLETREKCHKNRQLLKLNEKKHEQTKLNKVHYEQMIKDLNDKLMMTEMQRLNSKYRCRYL